MTALITPYLSTLDRVDVARAHEPAWLGDLRRSAASAFAKMGFPTTRDEEWRFTNVSPIAGTAFVPAPAAVVAKSAVSEFAVPGLAGPVMTFVNGRFAPRLSTFGAPLAGLTAVSLADAIAENPASLQPHFGRHTDFTTRPFAALNTAAFEDGA